MTFAETTIDRSSTFSDTRPVYTDIGQDRVEIFVSMTSGSGMITRHHTIFINSSGENPMMPIPGPEFSDEMAAELEAAFPDIDRETLGWLKLAESSFDFWDNEDDAIYDDL